MRTKPLLGQLPRTEKCNSSAAPSKSEMLLRVSQDPWWKQSSFAPGKAPSTQSLPSLKIRCEAANSEAAHFSLSPAPSLRPSFSLSLSHSAAAPSAPQLSRSTALSRIYTHTLSLYTHTTHVHAQTRTQAQPPAVSRIQRSGFSNGIPSASSPRDGRCSSRVSEHSERRSRVLLIGECCWKSAAISFARAGIAF